MIYLLIISTIIYTIFAFSHPRSALLSLLALSPLYLIRFSIGPIPTTMFEIFLLITVCAQLIHFRREIFTTFTQSIRKPSTLFWTIIILLIATLLSIFIAPNLLKALGLARAYIIEPLIIGFLIYATRKPDDLKVIAATTSYTVISIAISVFFQYTGGISFPLESWARELRFTGFYPFPNAIGLFVAPLVPLYIWSIIRVKSLVKVWYTIITIISLALVVLAQTEGALIAFAATAIIILARQSKRGFKIAATTALSGLAIIILSSSLLQKVTLQDWSGTVRRIMWHESWTMLTSSPTKIFLGAGLSGFPTAIVPFHSAKFEIFQYPHQIFLNLWSELGLLGLIATLTLFALLIKNLWSQKNPLATTLLASILILLIHGLVDVPFFKNDLAILTAVIISFSLCTLKK